MRLFARPEASEDILMARRTLTAGWLLMAVAALHAAFGLWVGRRALLAIARDGFVNAVDPHLDRALVFWFLLASPFLWMVGRFALWLASEGRRPPAWLGRNLLALALICAVLMPVSGFWLILPPATSLLLAARTGGGASRRRAAETRRLAEGRRSREESRNPRRTDMRILVCLALFFAASPASSAGPVRVGVVIFDGFLSGEVVAPLEVFAKATSEGSQAFEVFTVAASSKPVRSHEGLLIQPRETFATSPPLDILVVPSTLDMERALANQALVAFIKERGTRVRYLASHCAGAFLLGKAGLLDGRRATTYIGGAEPLQKMFPKARVEGDKHVVVDGNLVTSIGGAMSYEGSLALLERIAGAGTADQVAKALYYFRWKETKAAAAAGGAK